MYVVNIKQHFPSTQTFLNGGISSISELTSDQMFKLFCFYPFFRSNKSSAEHLFNFVICSEPCQSDPELDKIIEKCQFCAATGRN